MIRRLGLKFHLAQTAVDAGGCLSDGLGKELIVHEMGAGAGGQIAAVLYQLHAPEIDLPVSLYGLFDGISGFGKSGGIQDDHIVLFALLFQAGQQVKDVLTDEIHPVGKAV